MTLEPPRGGWHEDSGFTGRPFWDISADGREESKLFLKFFFFALPGNPSLPGAQQPNSSWNWGWEFLWLFGKGQSLDSFKPGWGKKKQTSNKKGPAIPGRLLWEKHLQGNTLSRWFMYRTQQFHEIHTRGKNGNSTPEVLPAGLWWLQEGVTGTPSDCLRCRRCNSGCTNRN